MRVRLRNETEASAYLLSFVNYEALARYRPTSESHDLRRFERDLRRLGWRPHRVPTVHVGGTNGKGTVSMLLEAILRAGGLHTGLYTSPHLRSWRERIRLDGRPLSGSRFRGGLEHMAGVAWPSDGGFRTTFEHLTALAFLTFQEAGVDVAVVEVGLGGRLDATNILAPGPAILTPISLDHRQILGSTVTRIAADKAHIVKRGGAAYLMPQGREAARVIRRHCRRLKVAPVNCSERVTARAVAWDGEGTTFVLRGRVDYGNIRTGFLGAHQEANVAAAVTVAETLLPPRILRDAVRRGLRSVRIPGRLDPRTFAGLPLLLDGGHNPSAGRAVSAALERHYPGARIVAVVGMAVDKDHRGFFRALRPRIASWHATGIPSPRGAPPELLVERIGGRVRGHATPGAAIRAAAREKPDLLLVAGSFVLVGEVLGQLRDT